MKDISELYDEFQNIKIPSEYLSFFEKILLNMDYNNYKTIMDGILEFGFNPACFDPKMQRLLRQFTPSAPVDDIIDVTKSELSN